MGIIRLLVFVALWTSAAAATNPEDVRALEALRRSLDPSGETIPWRSGDPCDNAWKGVFCENSAVTQIHLMELHLKGTIAPEVGALVNLQVLNLMWNDISGSIPSSIGKLQSLKLLLLNGNQLTGSLPEELGNLTNMNRLQVDENKLSGPIPSTFGNLSSVKHLHLNNNSFSGSIPPELGKLPTLFHLLVDNNNLSGRLPPELSNVASFQILQLDNNPFDSQVIPESYGSMERLAKLSMRNCSLRGAVLDFTGLPTLEYIDLSYNQLTGRIKDADMPATITSVDLSFNQLAGDITSAFARLELLEVLFLQNNRLNGTVPRGFLQRNSSILNFQNNSLSGLDFNASEVKDLWLYGNPKICSPNSSARFCLPENFGGKDDPLDNVTGACDPTVCVPGQSEVVPALSYERNCKCASPINLVCRLKSPGFTLFSPHAKSFESFMAQGLQLLPEQVHVASHNLEPGPRILINLKLFPTVATATRSFNRSEVLRIYQEFATWKIPDNLTFGPREFLSFTPPYGIELFRSDGKSRKSLSAGALAGILISVISFTALVVSVLFFKLSRKRRAALSRRAFLSRRALLSVNSALRDIKLDNVRNFTLEEILKATDGFSKAKEIGKGGYGTVYKGVLEDDQVVAIKRAGENSHQGVGEFLTEIELLSRIHHRNLVALLGYCLDDGERILVYEYVGGGSIHDRLAAYAKVPLDFKTRVYIALGAARGILYLHTEASPPIIHRDIKGTNILVTEKNLVKVSDFGLSRLAPEEVVEDASRHVSTVVKGTPGYLDPEYFLTRKLSDKSDVYSLGIVLLELITGRQAIYQGKNLNREVRYCYETGNALSTVDPRMGSYPSEAMEPLLRLALSCCEDTAELRPGIRTVVRDLENIWQILMKNEALYIITSEGVEESSLVSPTNFYSFETSTPSSSRVNEFSEGIDIVAPR